jgi:hypothetical protein
VGCLPVGVVEKETRLGEELARATCIWIDTLSLSWCHDETLSASGEPTRGVTGPRMIPCTKLFPLAASDANSAGLYARRSISRPT